MRIFITILSLSSFLLLAPLTSAAEATPETGKPTAGAMMTPGSKMPESMMPNDASMMMWKDQNSPSMMGNRMMMPHYFNYKIDYSPWGIVVCAITVGLIWVLLGSIIVALWTWIKKQK